MQKNWPRPKLVVSSCLNGEKCRYNGQDSSCKLVQDLKPFADITMVCPETGIGLETPREAIRVVGDSEHSSLINPTTNEDLTDRMTTFANEKINSFINDNINGVILKCKSPSCGLYDVKIYESEKRGCNSIKGRGIFASMVCEKLPCAIVEDDGRLKNFDLRDNFLNKIFIFAGFEEVKKSNNISSLIEFHTKNKLLFKTYSQDITTKLGVLIAKQNEYEFNTLIKDYGELLSELLKGNQKFRRCLHIFEKAYGYFNDNLNDEEKKFFRDTLEEYKNGKQAKKSIITLLKSYAIRFNDEYLLKQTILNPYPEELLNLDDSGKGIVR